jgi:hypothetical protein
MMYICGLIVQCLSLLLFHMSGATAHSLKELDQLFEHEALPTELIELTKEMETTAGMKSVREETHAKQHQLLDQYVQARTERKCAEALTTISRLDLEIVVLRERGDQEEEQTQRKTRDDTAAFIEKTCTSTSPTK